jgi:hypothetical protein
MRTPWGTSQNEKTLAPGVVQVDTAGHGGIHLDATHNAQVHKVWRIRGGWYGEDNEWVIVALTFPNLFTPEHIVMAHTSAKDWFPDEYEQVFRTKLLPAESYTRQEQMFRAATEDKWVATAAWGYRNNVAGRLPVPEGMVGVASHLGGHRRRGAPDAEERWFLVPATDYERREQFGFVVDEQRNCAWPELVAA